MTLLPPPVVARVSVSVCILSMFRRDILCTIGRFDDTMRGSEDYDLWLHRYRVAQWLRTLLPSALVWLSRCKERWLRQSSQTHGDETGGEGVS